jgi:purine-nucleoside phosphorylase
MAGRLPSFFQLEEYNVSAEDVVRVFLRCSPAAIRSKVIITPTWGAQIFASHTESVTTITDNLVWELRYQGEPLTVIRSGIGAPLTGDIVLALGCTSCEMVIFCGSVGGLDASMGLGDMLVVEKSWCGDGFSRYLSPEVLPHDCFLQMAAPHPSLTARLTAIARTQCAQAAVPLHEGSVFAIDSILAQFFRLDGFAQQYGCIGIEMETAATFKAAALIGVQASALLQVSDVLPRKKSFFSGITAQEHAVRRRIRAEVLSKIVLDLLVEESVSPSSAQ